MAGEKTEVHRTKRVFINNIDTYSSKHIAKFLSTCIPGASLEEAEAEEETSSLQDGTFTMVGTAANEGRKASFALEQYSSSNRDLLFRRLLECDVVVYNLSEKATPEHIEEATWAISALHSEIESFVSPKMFILLSSVMTWALTKPADPEDIEIPLTKDDYSRKRPHPNFKEHSNAEKLVLKLGKTKKSKLSSYVVVAGLQYGMGENLFHYFFKASWLGEFPRLPVNMTGTNVIPTIHVSDLAGVVQNIIDNKPKTHYFIAVDDSKNTFGDMVKAVSVVLGPGKTMNVPSEEPYLTRALPQGDLDYLGVNLRIEAVYLKENLNLTWVSESGMVDNINRVVEEYKLVRRLLPIRICLMGPPAVGKSTVAAHLCKHYKLHHIKLKDSIDERIAQLEEVVNGDQGSDREDSAVNAQEQLEAFKESMERNGGRLEDRYVYRIMREKLNSKPCRNQGFVFDGYPKSYDQAKELFFDGDMKVDNPRSKMLMYNKKIIPEFIFSLEASDAFLKERVQNLPENVAEKMRYTQDEFLHRLAEYRQANVEDETVLNYFDELEIHPEHLEVSCADDPEYTTVIENIVQVVGPPRNYGPTPEERVEQERAAEERQLRPVQEKAERKRREAAMAAKMAAQLEEWNRQVTEVKKQEHELLEARSFPLRNYLMRFVMPSLVEGMTECNRVKPEDPVDFLAEFLLRNNSQD